MDHFIIDTSLTEEQRGYLIDHHRECQAAYYKHTVGSDYTNLDMLFMFEDPIVAEIASSFSLPPSRATLMHVAPNATIVPHVDGTEYQRLSAVVFPLLPSCDNFAPTILYKDENASHLRSECYVFSTHTLHGVENNDNSRLALQLWYSESVEELYELQKNGKFFLSH
jgi:hypothetical protein